MSDSESIVKVPSSSSIAYRLYRRRFFIICVFGLLSFNQCLFWLTFSPIARNTEKYYNITESTVDLLLNWGNIICMPTFPLAYLLLNKPHGFRFSMILYAVTCLVATSLRVLPSIISSASEPRFSSIAVPFLHTGQILNAACSPLVQVPVSQLSCIWFGPNERARATTFAVMSNSFGGAVAFLISPWIADTPEHVPRLLYVHVGLAFIACVLTLAYFPSHPSTPPSPAAERLLSYSLGDNSLSSLRGFMKELWQCMTSPTFMLLSIVGGLSTGVFTTWTGLYDVILAPENYSEQQAGWFGFGSIIAGMVGGLSLGALADMHRFQRSLKMLIIISLVGCFVSIVWFELSVHTLFYDKVVLSSTSFSIGSSIALAGLFQGASTPLIFEALAEVMFPLPESISALMINLWNSSLAIILLFLAPNRYKLMNLLVLIIVGICIIMVCLSRMVYKRRDEDQRKLLEKQEEVSNDNHSSSYDDATTN